MEIGHYDKCSSIQVALYGVITARVPVGILKG